MSKAWVMGSAFGCLYDHMIPRLNEVGRCLIVWHSESMSCCHCTARNQYSCSLAASWPQPRGLTAVAAGKVNFLFPNIFALFVSTIVLPVYTHRAVPCEEALPEDSSSSPGRDM